MSKIRAALTRKLGPLPAWAWGLIFAGGAWWWSHRSGSSSGSTNTPTDSSLTTSSTDTGAGSGGGFGGGFGGGSGSSGGGGDGSSGVPTPTPPETGPIQTPPPADTPPPPDQSPPPDSGGGDPVAQPPSAIRIPKLSQPPTQHFLQWGGQTFTTQAAFAAWAKAHGSSVARELANHPEAAQIYANLGKTAATAATIFLPRKSGAGTPAAVPPRTTPVSVRSTPPRQTIRTTTAPPAQITPPRVKSAPKTIAAGAVRGGGSPTAPAGAPQPKPAAPHYYTYKKDVALKSGQTVHFTSGRGYYAA